MKEESDLKLNRVECPKCHSIWLDGTHYWSGTGKRGDEETLNNLVCAKLSDNTCINPKKISGQQYENADSWEKRLQFINNWSPE
tara:strand:+ start:597 stop:848 length:252 start_codon:yes stop_codon:yes gene_type:complete